MPRSAGDAKSSRQRILVDKSSKRKPGARFWTFAAILALAAATLAFLAIAVLAPEPAAQARRRAEAASRAGEHLAAARAWNRFNQSRNADAQSLLAEARANLALGRVRLAEALLARASELDPSLADPWLIRLEVLRVEQRLAEAALLGRQAITAVNPARRIEVLRSLTLALLAEAPDDLARATLQRWIDADPDDLNAHAALHRRMHENPRSADPKLDQRLKQLRDLLAKNPDHAGVREALLLVLAEAGLPDEGRAVLEAWPESQRDARFHALQGRWLLEYDQNPKAAVHALQAALKTLPHDTKTRYRLARALQASGLDEQARSAAADVTRLRELLEPVRLSNRLDTAFARLRTLASSRSLAELCESVGLMELAAAWSAEAEYQRASSR